MPAPWSRARTALRVRVARTWSVGSRSRATGVVRPLNVNKRKKVRALRINGGARSTKGSLQTGNAARAGAQPYPRRARQRVSDMQRRYADARLYISEILV